MQFPQTPFGLSEQKLQTHYLSKIAAFQSRKNRSYTQLKPGDNQHCYMEANLGSVQLLREQLTSATHIRAAPPKQFLPIAVPLASSKPLRFCGRAREENTLLQATGDEWDIATEGFLDYAALVFDYDSLNLQYQHLYQREIPSQWLFNKAIESRKESLNSYTNSILYAFKLIARTDNLFQSVKTCELLANSLTQTTLKTVLNIDVPRSLSPHSRRIAGVYRVIDYLQSFASCLPSISELCKVANLSERSLEYGFREYLGITPIRYLKVVRLNGVRETLLTSDASVTVSHVALQWGFLELGRFAAEYRQLFGELPSKTLKQG
ncbi:hypothetical protein TUM3792_43980 [Shewanella sp. MBTL60-007]|nr:hypothetical protein TUM3792_43980 [Shewanella sp. MBTL60-007]